MVAIEPAHLAESSIVRRRERNGTTYALVDRWLVGSCLTASAFSSSSLLRLLPGTDLDGSLSSIMKREMMPDCGDVNCDPDRPGLLKRPGGEVKLEVEYLFGRENAEGKPEAESRYSGGVVGSETWPVIEVCCPGLLRSSCINASSCSSRRCCRSNNCISASNRRFCSRSRSYSSFFFSSCIWISRDFKSHSLWICNMQGGGS